MKNEDENKGVDPSALRRNRRMATIIGTCFIIVLIALVYAFVQQVAAEKNAEEAMRQKMLAKQSEVIAQQNAMEAQRQEARAKELQDQLDKCLRSQK